MARFTNTYIFTFASGKVETSRFAAYAPVGEGARWSADRRRADGVAAARRAAGRGNLAGGGGADRGGAWAAGAVM